MFVDNKNNPIICPPPECDIHPVEPKQNIKVEGFSCWDADYKLKDIFETAAAAERFNREVSEYFPSNAEPPPINLSSKIKVTHTVPALIELCKEYRSRSFHHITLSALLHRIAKTVKDDEWSSKEKKDLCDEKKAFFWALGLKIKKLFLEVKPRQIATMLWAFKVLEYRDNPSLIQSLFECAKVLEKEFSIRDVVMTLYAYSYLVTDRDYGFESIFFEKAKEKIKAANIQDIYMISQSCYLLGYYDEDMMSLIVSSVEEFARASVNSEVSEKDLEAINVIFSTLSLLPQLSQAIKERIGTFYEPLFAGSIYYASSTDIIYV